MRDFDLRAALFDDGNFGVDQRHRRLFGKAVTDAGAGVVTKCHAVTLEWDPSVCKTKPAFTGGFHLVYSVLNA